MAYLTYDTLRSLRQSTAGSIRTHNTVYSSSTTRRLLLDLEVAVRLRAEVAVVEVVHAHEAVLAARRVAVALWRHRDSKITMSADVHDIRKRKATHVLTGPK